MGPNSAVKCCHILLWWWTLWCWCHFTCIICIIDILLTYPRCAVYYFILSCRSFNSSRRHILNQCCGSWSGFGYLIRTASGWTSRIKILILYGFFLKRISTLNNRIVSLREPGYGCFLILSSWELSVLDVTF